MDRARQLLQWPIENANQIAAIASEGQPTQRKSRKVIGRSGADYILLDTDDVLAFQAERELVWIITAKLRLLATQSLRLAPVGGVQVAATVWLQVELEMW